MSVDIVKLLELYESYPCLWDKAHPDFKNRVKRDAAEQALLPRSGLASIRELRQKIRSIRCTYNQEVAKVRASVRGGLGAEEKYVPKLWWFSNADKFLRKNHEAIDLELNATYGSGEGSSFMDYEFNGGGLQTSPPQPLFPVNGQEESAENSLHSSNQHSLNNHNNRIDASHLNPFNRIGEPGPSTSVLNSFWHEKKVKKRAVDETVDCAVKVLQELSNRRLRNSEFAVFGEHVATQLQQLPLDSAVQLQQDIQNLITKARLDALRNSAMTASFTRTNASPPSDQNGEGSDSLQIHFHVGAS